MDNTFATLLTTCAAALAVPACDGNGPAPVALTPDTIALQIVRMDGGTGMALVSNGIPLPQGRLSPDDIGHVKIVVAGQEQPLYAEALGGTYRDGSARALLVQLAYDVAPGMPVQTQLVIGPSVTRALPDRPKMPVTWTMPPAVALPTLPAYLVSTELIGKTIPLSTSPASPPIFRTYETNFVTFGDRHWATEAGNWTYNYYDRALIWYAWWVRTGNPDYWRRGAIDAVAYRDQYVVPANYQMQPHNALLEGLAVHYLLTGDEASRTAVDRVATAYAQIWTPQLGCWTCDYVEGRIQARTLLSHYLAWMIGAPGKSARDWKGLMETDVSKILASQRPDGSYRFADWQMAHSNYMAGLVHDALIKYYTYVDADPRIPPAIRKTLDWMWATQWDQTTQSFKYLSDVTTSGGPTPAPDLNLLIVTGYGWYFAHSHDPTYKTHADAIFTGGVRGAFLDGYKQFNQNYVTSFHYLFYRQ